MSNPRHPAAILRGAWSTTRLPLIRNVIDETLVALNALDPREVLGRELSGAEGSPGDCPVREALAACCDELRLEGGVAMLRDREAFADLPAERAPAWGVSYANALDKYRDAAGALLDRGFSGLAARTAAAG